MEALSRAWQGMATAHWHSNDVSCTALEGNAMV
nr:MAG TPA: hypothetical protein [Bacteriophage sp.]